MKFVIIMLFIGIVLSTREAKGLRPIRRVETKRTSPFSIEILLNVIKDSKDEGWRKKELVLMTTLKLNKAGVYTILLKTQYDHWYFYVEDFLIDPEPNWQAMKIARVDVVILPLPTRHPFYEGSEYVSEDEKQEVLDDIIVARTSSVEKVAMELKAHKKNVTKP